MSCQPQIIASWHVSLCVLNQICEVCADHVQEQAVMWSFL